MVEFGLPSGDDFNQIQKSNKTYGRLKTFITQLQSHFFSILIVLLLIVFQWGNNERFNKIETKNTNQTNVYNNSPIPDSSMKQSDQTLAAKNLFDPQDWIIDNFNKENGYYCPTVNEFNLWSMWSKKKFSPNFSTKIRLQIKNKNAPSPTIVISYGDYNEEEKSPTVFYSLNIFDTDTKSIRLYDQNNKGQAQEWLKEIPIIGNEMVIELSPRVPDPSSRRVKVNMAIKYSSGNSEEGWTTFTPKNDFSVLLPSVDLEDGSIQKQLGIGVRKGVCIKILAFE